MNYNISVLKRIKNKLNDLVHDHFAMHLIAQDGHTALRFNINKLFMITLIFMVVSIYFGAAYSKYEQDARIKRLDAITKLAIEKKKNIHLALNELDETSKLLDVLREKQIKIGRITTGDYSFKIYEKDNLYSEARNQYLQLVNNQYINILIQVPHSLPTDGNITSDYGFRVHPIYGKWRKHEGVDIGNKIWTMIYSPMNGIVTHSGRYGGNLYGYGRVIIIQNNYYTTLFAHLRATKVSVGDKVTRGMLLGYMGSSGNSTGSHLHYEVLTYKSLNPFDFLIECKSAMSDFCTVKR